VAIGYKALEDANEDGINRNTAVGHTAALNLTTGASNTAIGSRAMTAAVTGDNNTVVGESAAVLIEDGYRNTCIGQAAGDAITSGFNNICLGSATDPSANNAENQFVIGYNFNGNGDNKVSIGSASGYVWNSYTANATWTQVSDKRTKKNIETDFLGLDFINELRPVTFNWKPISEIDPDFIAATANIGNGEKDTETLMHGLIAQEVKSAMDAVGNDTFNGWEEGRDGQAISREMFITPLIKAVQELSEQVKEQAQRIKELEN